MVSTANDDLRTFQVKVRDKIRELGRQLHWTGGPQVERDLGLDNLGHEVTVTVVVPAATEEDARAQVGRQVDGLFLPSGWSASVR